MAATLLTRSTSFFIADDDRTRAEIGSSGSPTARRGRLRLTFPDCPASLGACLNPTCPFRTGRRPAMTRKLHGRRQTPDHRRLIHLLNQRYHQEFLRAERLRAPWLLRG